MYLYFLCSELTASPKTCLHLTLQNCSPGFLTCCLKNASRVDGMKHEICTIWPPALQIALSSGQSLRTCNVQNARRKCELCRAQRQRKVALKPWPEKGSLISKCLSAEWMRMTPSGRTLAAGQHGMHRAWNCPCESLSRDLEKLDHVSIMDMCLERRCLLPMSAWIIYSCSLSQTTP